MHVLLGGGLALLLLVPASAVTAMPPWPSDSVEPGPRTAAANKRIGRLIPARISHRSLGRNVSITVTDTATGRDVFNRRAHHGLAAASNTKLVTSLIALHSMGPDRRIPTVVRRTARHRIVLVGGGDSLLTSENVSGLARRTARALRRDGIRGVRVNVDASLYRWRGPGRGWASYEVGSNIGRVEPLNMNDARTGDGPGYAGRYFTSRLRAAGIAATYRGRRASGERTPVISRYRGHRVKSIVRATLLPSDSDHAEALGRLVAIDRGLRPTYGGWWRAAKSVLKDLGIKHRGIRLYDAAGLSQRNRLTTAFISDLLIASMDRSNPRMNVLLRERRLPTAGRTGTLSASLGRFVGPAYCARGKIFAKTGTIAGVVALSGYARGADNRWKVFSILVNNRPGVNVLSSRQALDRIAATVTGCY